MGVALIIKRCGAALKPATVLPFSTIDCRCVTPKRCCSSMTTSCKSLYTVVLLNKAWVPTKMFISPAFSAFKSGERAAALIVPLKKAARTPTGSKRRAIVSACCLAKISVGAMTAHWPPQSIARRQAKTATKVFPEPTSPCKSRCIVQGAFLLARPSAAPLSLAFKSLARSS